ncbi:MAG: transposase [Thermoplasmata archaeon]|jgi:putative transposase
MAAIRTVILPFTAPPQLLRALFDVRSAVNRIIPDWRKHIEESRFDATKRWYPVLRRAYGHLAASWAIISCNEASATLNTWDGILRYTRQRDPAKFERIRNQLPRRVRLKASLHKDIYRLRGGILDITVRPKGHVRIDLRGTKNPLFWRYLEASGGTFGLTVTDRKLAFNFRLPLRPLMAQESVGVDLNMPSADFATSDGEVGSVSLRLITQVQGAMNRKRQSIQRTIPIDLDAQRRVLKRYRGRERNRVMPILHRVANELLAKAGEKNIVLEDLSRTTEGCERTATNGEQRRRLSVWTHGQFTRIVTYKARTAVVRVNPRGTSSECPRCGGPLAHPEWRRASCGNCQGEWHRDRGAAIVILERGLMTLRGATLPPRARNALLEAAVWRPGSETIPGLRAEPVMGDDAKVG